MPCLRPHLREHGCGLAHTSEDTFPYQKEGMDERGYGFMCWPINRIGKANAQLTAFSLKNGYHLCGTVGYKSLWNHCSVGPEGARGRHEGVRSLFLQWDPVIKLMSQASSASSLPAEPSPRPLCFPLRSSPRLWDGIPQTWDGSSLLSCIFLETPSRTHPEEHLPVQSNPVWLTMLDISLLRTAHL